MSRKRYLKDYQLTPEVSRNGRVRPTASYVGAYYRFTAEPERLRRGKWLLSGFLAVAVALTFVQLWFTDLMDTERRFLVLPMVFNVFPAFGMTVAVYHLWQAPDRMTLKQRDRISNRLPAFSLFYVIFSLLGFAGTVAQLVLNGVTTPTALYCLNAGALTAVTVVLFCQRGLADTEPIHQ